MQTGVQVVGGCTAEGQGGIALTLTVVLTAEQAQEIQAMLSKGQIGMALAVANHQAERACRIVTATPPEEEQVPDASQLTNEQKSELLQQMVRADKPDAEACGCG